MSDGEMTPGEVSRSLMRIEQTLSKVEQHLEDKLEEALRQISHVRHRVANLEARQSLSGEFVQRVGLLFDRVDELEKREIAEQAVTDFKKYVIGGSLLGAVLVVLNIITAVRSLT